MKSFCLAWPKVPMNWRQRCGFSEALRLLTSVLTPVDSTGQRFLLLLWYQVGSTKQKAVFSQYSQLHPTWRCQLTTQKAASYSLHCLAALQLPPFSGSFAICASRNEAELVYQPACVAALIVSDSVGIQPTSRSQLVLCSYQRNFLVFKRSVTQEAGKKMMINMFFTYIESIPFVAFPLVAWIDPFPPFPVLCEYFGVRWVFLRVFKQDKIHTYPVLLFQPLQLCPVMPQSMLFPRRDFSTFLCCGLGISLHWLLSVHPVLPLSILHLTVNLGKEALILYLSTQ